MQETYKYSILEKKHVTLQMGSSTAMKRKGNFNQGSSKGRYASVENVSVFWYFQTNRLAACPKRTRGFFQKHHQFAQKVEKKITSASVTKPTMLVISLERMF